MYVDSTDSDFSDWEVARTRGQECSLNGYQVYILDEKSPFCSLQFETRLKEGFSLAGRKDGIKPMMSGGGRVSGGASYSEKEGFKGEIKVEFEFGPSKDVGKSDNENSSSDAAGDTSGDIDSGDRCSDNEKS